MLRPRHIFRALCALLLPVLLCTGGISTRPVQAQSSTGRGRSAQLQARALFKESQDLQRAGDLRGALAKLEEAYEILPTPTLLWPIAELRLSCKRPLQGLEALSRYRQEIAPSEMEPGQQIADADRLEEKLRAQLGALRPIAVPGATITVDGRELGRAPLPDKVMVNPGSHVISASSSDKGRPIETTVEVQAGQELEVPLTDENQRSGGGYFPHPLTWAAIGLTTAALLATTVLGGVTLQKTRSLDESCPGRLCLGGTSQNILQLNEQVSSQRRHAIAAGTVLGFTSLFIVGTTVLILVDRQRQKRGRTLFGDRVLGPRLGQLRPVVNASPDGVAFALGGRF
jgi:hypothetical protein